MANRMQSEASNPENDLKDPVQANSSDIDERMSTQLPSHHSFSTYSPYFGFIFFADLLTNTNPSPRL